MRQLASRYRLELYLGHVANIEIRWINERLGHGIFASQSFKKNTFIAEYTGEVGFLDPIHGPSNPYLLRYPRPFFSLNFLQVNAENMGNETRFLNHSDRPNLLTQIALDRGLLRSFFVTKRPIQKGEQLTFNYGTQYWRHFDNPQSI